MTGLTAALLGATVVVLILVLFIICGYEMDTGEPFFRRDRRKP